MKIAKFKFHMENKCKAFAKRWWRENKTDCKIKERQKYNRKPQKTKQTKWWRALCGEVNEGHDRTVHGCEPHTKRTCTHT